MNKNIESDLFNNCVFISYSHDDQNIADKIFRQFKSKYIDVWLDNNKLRQGDEFTIEIVEAINNSCCFIPIITNSANDQIMTSRYYKKEWNYASQNINMEEIYPVRTGDFNDQFPYAAGAFTTETINLLLKDNPEILLRRQQISSPDYILKAEFLDEIKRIQYKSRMQSLKRNNNE